MADEFDQGDLSPREEVDIFDDETRKPTIEKEKTFLSEY